VFHLRTHGLGRDDHSSQQHDSNHHNESGKVLAAAKLLEGVAGHCPASKAMIGEYLAIRTRRR
jgi:hypothetical protein